MTVSYTARLALGLALLALAACKTPADKPESARAGAVKRPNVLILFTDDQSIRTVSAYPEAVSWASTPHIDALAAEGVRVTHFYPGTWCTPARGTLLTGRQPYGFDTFSMQGRYPSATYNPDRLPFWPKQMREAGYTTAMIGKWHFGTDAGWGRDWDYQVVWNRPGNPDNAGAYFTGQMVEVNGGPLEPLGGYSTDEYTKLAVDFINGENRDADKPWVMWLAYAGVHKPFTPADRHMDLYEGEIAPVPQQITGERPGKPEYIRKLNDWQEGPEGYSAPSAEPWTLHGTSLDDIVRQYNQSVAAIDESVGEIIRALNESGQREETLVIFMSDQGIAMGEFGFLAMKVAPYDDTLRAPLIVSMPGTIPEGKVLEAAVGGVDIPPTLLDYMGEPPAWDMHGRSLRAVLENPKRRWNHPVLQIQTGYKFGEDTYTLPDAPEDRQLLGVPWWISITDGKYKYIRNLVPGEIDELYDLQADPEEIDNLAGKPAFERIRASMREQMDAELRRTSGPLFEDL